MPHMSHRFLLTVLFALAATAMAAAQDEAPSDEDSKAAIQAVYQMSQQAKSIAELDQMIDECRRLLEKGLTKTYEDYIKQLASWAYNRRGELRSEEADSQGSGDAASAMEDFNAAIELDPTRGKAYHNRGVNYAMLGEYDKALAEFDLALRHKPTYANSWFNRGEIHYEQGKYEQAIADYNSVIRLNRADADAYTRRGHAYFKLRKYREALNDYSRAVSLKRNDAMSYLNRGEAFLSLGMWGQAAQDYRQAIMLDRSLARAYQGAAWLMATSPDARYRSPSRAATAALQAIELAGDEADYRYYDTLAAAYAAANNFPKAQEAIATAIEKAPPDKAEDLKQRQTLYQRNRPYLLP
jgi:tetratricopeptide (TPR) repeat protein